MCWLIWPQCYTEPPAYSEPGLSKLRLANQPSSQNSQCECMRASEMAPARTPSRPDSARAHAQWGSASNNDTAPAETARLLVLSLLLQPARGHWHWHCATCSAIPFWGNGQVIKGKRRSAREITYGEIHQCNRIPQNK